MPNNSSKAMGSQNRKRRRRSLLKSQGPFCFYCKQEFPEKELTLDHKIPYSKGGKSHLGNLVLACEPCNHAKGNSKAEAFTPTQRMEEGL